RRSVSYREGALHLRSTFLYAMSKALSDHTDFWSGETKLMVAADLRRKFKSFPVNTDQHLVHLAGSSGKAPELLYSLFVDHLNSGKRTRGLTFRYPVSTPQGLAVEEDEEAVA